MRKRSTGGQFSKSVRPLRRAAATRPGPASWTPLAVCGLLVALTSAVYLQAVWFPYANLDDNEYVFQNRNVVHGLSAKGIVWAFSETHVAGHWHPVTWLSLMLDTDFYGSKSALGYHLTNVVLHAANAVILFLVLRQMTGALWPSALAAALFAVHPVHVESVVWITERKDVLSGFFGLLAIWAYARYARRPSVGGYLQVAAALALGLMSKPILVTWPLVFLLLDYWPLDRLRSRSLALRALLEKVPLALLAAASAAVTFLVQRSAGAVVSLESSPIPARICRAGMLYAGYLRKTFWPAGLIVYSGEPSQDLWPALGAGVLLALLTAAAVWGAWRGRRWLAVGWFWFLATLLPTIGLVQVGVQVQADRFLYLPQIGLCIAVAWGAAALLGRKAGSREQGAGSNRIAVAAAALVVAGLAAAAWQQTGYWRDSIILWEHALECGGEDYFVRHTLANALTDHGRMQEAVVEYQRALALNPNFVDTYQNLGAALATCGRFDEGIAYLRKALAIKPDRAMAHSNLGVALILRGRAEDVDEAIGHFRKALDANRDDPSAHNSLGVGLLRAKRFDEATAEFQQALDLKPDYVEARQNLERARARQQPSPGVNPPPPP